jgi:cilia- and flagella-associated protein 298
LTAFATVIIKIFHRRKLIARLIEIEELVKHGTMLPPEIVELLPEQCEELGLKDMWAQKCAPPGWILNKDPIGRRCGRQPPPNLQHVLTTAKETAKHMVSKVKSN